MSELKKDERRMKYGCDYMECYEGATVSGYVMKQSREGEEFPRPVMACDKHKMKPEFIKLHDLLD